MFISALSVCSGDAFLDCTFDDNTFCSFGLEGDYDWSLAQGPTPSSNTGPNFDHTSGRGILRVCTIAIPDLSSPSYVACNCKCYAAMPMAMQPKIVLQLCIDQSFENKL